MGRQGQRRFICVCHFLSNLPKITKILTNVTCVISWPEAQRSRSHCVCYATKMVHNVIGHVVHRTM